MYGKDYWTKITNIQWGERMYEFWESTFYALGVTMILWFFEKHVKMNLTFSLFKKIKNEKICRYPKYKYRFSEEKVL